MAGTYAFAFDESSVYASVRDLVLRATGPGIVVDLGCGFGALAEPVKASGRHYIGADREAEGLHDLESRGFDTHQIDVTDLAALEQLLRKVRESGPLSAILMLDTLEHLPLPGDVLSLLADLAPALGAPVLIVSIPNVTHVDVAAKLLVGRWDVTRTGLLDSTHLQMFSARRLELVMRESGWFECDSSDFRLIQSDQHFPTELPVLLPGSPIADLVADVRARADEFAYVNQFVRAYIAGATRAGVAETPATPTPFLSVLVRTTGSRPETLRDLMLCFAAQTDGDFELLLLAHGVTPAQLSELSVLLSQQSEFLRSRCRLFPVEPGGGRSRPLNVGVERGRGSYLCVVDDDDVVLSSYVSEFHKLAAEQPGRMLRTVVVDQRVRECPWGHVQGYEAYSSFLYAYPPRYDVLFHLTDNGTPFCGLAFPTLLFHELGNRFDEDLPVLEDWEMQLTAVQACGAHSSPTITSIYHRWDDAEVGTHSKALHAEHQWEAARSQIASKLDARPLVLPRGSYSALRDQLMSVELRMELDAVHHAKEAAEARLAEVHASGSWRLTAPIRRLTGLRHRRRKA